MDQKIISKKLGIVKIVLLRWLILVCWSAAKSKAEKDEGFVIQEPHSRLPSDQKGRRWYLY